MLSIDVIRDIVFSAALEIKSVVKVSSSVGAVLSGGLSTQLFEVNRKAGGTLMMENIKLQEGGFAEMHGSASGQSGGAVYARGNAVVELNNVVRDPLAMSVTRTLDRTLNLSFAPPRRILSRIIITTAARVGSWEEWNGRATQLESF